jgi:uncharacterized protein (UPF0333 family)
MKHKSSLAAGFVSMEIIFVVLVLLVIGIAGYFVVHELHSSPVTPSATTKTPNAATNSYAVLSPATVASKVPECTTPISFQTNGNSGPVQCTNGDLNATEWNALSALEPTVMSLGYAATPAQVQAALCSDATASNSDANTKNSFIVEGTVYQISALYYGWNFPSNPSAVLSNGSC